MPVSVGWELDGEGCDGGGEVVYGRYDLVLRTVNNVSINEGPSEVERSEWWKGRDQKRDIPFSRNSSSWAVSSLRMSGSGRLCLRRARTYSARAAGSASHL